MRIFWIYSIIKSLGTKYHIMIDILFWGTEKYPFLSGIYLKISPFIWHVIYARLVDRWQIDIFDPTLMFMTVSIYGCYSIIIQTTFHIYILFLIENLFNRWIIHLWNIYARCTNAIYVLCPLLISASKIRPTILVKF